MMIPVSKATQRAIARNVHRQKLEEGSGMSRAKCLIDAAEATVLINDPNPNEKGKVIIGFRIDRGKVGIASLIGAFNEMVDLAESAMPPRS